MEQVKRKRPPPGDALEPGAREWVPPEAAYCASAEGDWWGKASCLSGEGSGLVGTKGSEWLGSLSKKKKNNHKCKVCMKATIPLE